MPRNIESKFRSIDLPAARRDAERLADRRLPDEVQTDTYFHAACGRLKLRQILGQPSVLIWYRRPDAPAARRSDYTLWPVADDAGLLSILSGAAGVITTVRKRREIYLADNVRIHLDRVDGLGEFLEFEAVLQEGVPDETGRRQIERLAGEFRLAASQLVCGSYLDLMS